MSEAGPPVAIVISGVSLAGSGGAERRFIRLWSHLINRGIPCVLVTNRALFESAVQAGLIENRDYGGALFLVPDGNAFTRSWAIFHAVLISGSRLVHLPLVQVSLSPFYALLQTRPEIKVVHTVAAVWFAYPGPWPWWTRLLGRWIWRFADAIDSLYPRFIDLHARPLGFEQKVTVSPCSFTDLAKYARQPERKEKVVVFAGALNEEKDPLLFLEALSILRRWNVPFSALIAGRGPLETVLRSRIADFRLDRDVTVAAYPDMSEVFLRSSIFVSLQLTENYPSQSLIEAMAAGNAIVATDVGETRRLVLEGRTGFLIGREPHQLAEKLRLLLEDDDLREKLGKAARDLIQQDHRIDRFADYILEIWRRVDLER